jgi:hypothetical protein
MLAVNRVKIHTLSNRIRRANFSNIQFNYDKFTKEKNPCSICKYQKGGKCALFVKDNEPVDYMEARKQEQYCGVTGKYYEFFFRDPAYFIVFSVGSGMIYCYGMIILLSYF